LASSKLPDNPATTADVLARFDVNAENLHQALADVSDDAFNDIWSLTHGDKTLLSLPRTAVVRTMVLNHLIHHRGQMSVYLRLLDIAVPSIYGGSADEAPQR